MLVVGLAPVYSVVAQLFGGATWTLAFAYGITVLPYAYRAIQANLDAVDVVTLSEAARSLGAGWVHGARRACSLPNLRRGVLAAAFISVAVVLGEFTIASLLNRRNLQTALLQVVAEPTRTSPSSSRCWRCCSPSSCSSSSAASASIRRSGDTHDHHRASAAPRIATADT